ncbi:GPR1/FUN34/yaaH family-domain-containing protein [Hypoxylon argillaceum]|nr:GPR1/FUN34/yaaH family-domain-containing protein [Hypoxylon argillaceum]KAI1152290.1 GPR1/FUN34/yaaH family-domain-containing protein [Nemania diffusa]
MANQQIPYSMSNHDEEKGLHRTPTGVTMSPELFEKLYLSPKVPHVGDYSKRFANPTALGFIGFVISASTFAMIIMGWGGTTGLSPVAGIFFFVGPVTMILALIFEWILGNFFSMMVMGLFSVFWLSFGLLEVPNLALGIPFATPDDPTGMASREYNAAIGLYLIVWGFAFFTFFIFTTRINAVLSTIFSLTAIATWLLATAYFKSSWGDYEAGGKYQKAGGAIIFAVSLLGWYMCFVIMAGEMRIRFNFPVGDLSHFWPSTNVELATRDHSD